MAPHSKWSISVAPLGEGRNAQRYIISLRANYANPLHVKELPQFREWERLRSITGT